MSDFYNRFTDMCSDVNHHTQLCKLYEFTELRKMRIDSHRGFRKNKNIILGEKKERGKNDTGD